MSVINPNNTIDFSKQTQFFGESLSIQRYDKYRYPILHQLYKTQRSNFWSPSEISLQKDRLDYHSLSEHEKFIYTSNLKYQILLDSIQSRSIVLAFLPFVSLPELEKNFITQSFFETIHSESYTHIIENVYDRPSEIFDNILDIPEIIERAESVTKYYDDFIELSSTWNNSTIKELIIDNNLTAKSVLYDLKKSLYLAIVNVNILESIRFYTSFACSFGFAENAKMIGSSDIISLIARDEACYISGHECLTETGWKLIAEVTKDDKVAQINQYSILEFVSPTAIINKPYVGKICRFVDNGNSIEQIVTEDHRMVWKNLSNNRMQESLAIDTKFTNDKGIYVSGTVTNGVVELSSIEILNIYFEYCGTIKSVVENDLYVQFSIKSVDNWRKLGRALSELGISYHYKINYKTDVYTVDTKLPQITLQKYFSWVSIAGKSSIWAQNFINLCRILDNSLHTTVTIPVNFKFNIRNTKSLGKLQEVFSISGWRVKHTSPLKSYCGYRIHVNTNSNYHISNNCSKTIKEYNGQVYCISVPSGAFLVRYNDKVSVGGNCHVRLTETVIKNWQAGEDVDFLQIIKEEQNTVYAMYENAVNEEVNWSKYLFNGGSILGLNQVLLENYVKFIANRRIKAIGMKPIYDISTKNPLPWMENYLKSGNLSVAPQETEIISYRVGNTKRDMSQDQFANYEL